MAFNFLHHVWEKKYQTKIKMYYCILRNIPILSVGPNSKPQENTQQILWLLSPNAPSIEQFLHEEFSTKLIRSSEDLGGSITYIQFHQGTHTHPSGPFTLEESLANSKDLITSRPSLRTDLLLFTGSILFKPGASIDSVNK